MVRAASARKSDSNATDRNDPLLIRTAYASEKTSCNYLCQMDAHESIRAQTPHTSSVPATSVRARREGLRQLKSPARCLFSVSGAGWPGCVLPQTQPDRVQVLRGRNQSYRINPGGIAAPRSGAVKLVSVLDATDDMKQPSIWVLVEVEASI